MAVLTSNDRSSHGCVIQELADSTICARERHIYTKDGKLSVYRTMFAPKINLNQCVAILGLVLSLSVFLLMTRYGIPERIAFGSAILSILVVAIFWTAVNLGDDDEEEF